MGSIKNVEKPRVLEEEEKWMEHFPSKNPNPVLRVGDKGEVLYSNAASVPLLEHWKVSAGGKLPHSMREMVGRAVLRRSPEKLEVKVGDHTYLFTLNPLPEEGYVNLYGFDISSQKRTEEQLLMRERQHLALNKLGKMALACKKLQVFMKDSTKLISRTLEVEYCKILELLPEGDFLLKAGTGWKPGTVGRTIVEGQKDSQAGYTLLTNKPVIVEDVEKETRFRAPELLKEHGVVSGMSIIIGDINRPFGVMGVHSTKKREFTREDIYFLSSATLIIAEVIERIHAEEEVRRQREHLEEMVEKRTGELTKINRRLKKEITDRKQAQKILQKSEERYRTATEQTGQLVYDCDLGSGEIDWAGAIRKLTGYDPREFQQVDFEGWSEHIHPEDRKNVLASHARSLQTGEKLHEEYRFRRKDGTYFYAEDSGTYLRDESGCICRVVGVMKDTTERRLAIEKLRESEERYRSFLKNFRGIVFQGDMNYNAHFMHGSLEEITGYREEDFVPGGLKWKMIIDPEDLPAVREDSKKLKIAPGASTEREYRIKRKDGDRCWVHEIVQSIPDESGKPILVQGSIYDITERKAAEEALAKAEETRKKEIHHRIKNNLQVISSLLSLQAEKFTDEAVTEAFRESQNRVISMSLIHEELYRSKEMETLDFAAYLKKLTADLLRTYRVRSDEISLKLDIEEVRFGMDTAIPLGIIINELVSNSLKHAFPEGKGGEILIKLFQTDHNKNKVISRNRKINKNGNSNYSTQFSLIVSDNGSGFPENIDFRNTASLGLQLVNTLVEQLEGKIELERNEGTNFIIRFRETG